jgi:hypothetical protein
MALSKNTYFSYGSILLRFVKIYEKICPQRDCLCFLLLEQRLWDTRGIRGTPKSKTQNAMTSSPTSSKPSIPYSPGTIARAERALRCSPFKLSLFEAMRSRSVPLSAIAASAGLEQGYTQRPLLELVAESNLVWLIQVGLLRREVDGQGITDSFRLTPLGRQLVEKYEKLGPTFPPPSGSDRIANALNRWLRLPF